MKISKRLKKFSVWGHEKFTRMELPCKSGMGNIAFFNDYQKSGVVLMGCGNEEGIDPEKDALVIDKDDVPAVIEFLKASIAE